MSGLKLWGTSGRRSNAKGYPESYRGGKKSSGQESDLRIETR